MSVLAPLLSLPLLRARRPHRLIERSIVIYRRTWLIFVSGFFEPFFYLMSIRIGLGKLIETVDVGGRTIDYATFVAPGLMAASAMNGALYDSTMNVYFKMKHAKTYDAILSTPLTSADVAVGEILFACVRGAVYAAVFLLTMLVLGLVESPWVVLAVPICFLLALAFASVGMAVTTYMRSFNDFDYVPTVMLPLFLLSATFFPLAEYGSAGWIVQLSPLYHGVAMVRDANLGTIGPAWLGHIAVLGAMVVIGVSVASHRVERLLKP